MAVTVYYSPKGKPHTVKTDYTPSGYVVMLDGKLHATADDRAELDEAVKELIRRKRFSETPRPKRKTPLVPASK